MRHTVSVCLSVCLSVRLSVRPVVVAVGHVYAVPLASRHGCTFRHALRAAYSTAISAAQILVINEELLMDKSYECFLTLVILLRQNHVHDVYTHCSRQSNETKTSILSRHYICC